MTTNTTKKAEIVKTGLNVYEVRINGITVFEGTRAQCKAYLKEA